MWCKNKKNFTLERWWASGQSYRAQRKSKRHDMSRLLAHSAWSRHVSSNRAWSRHVSSMIPAIAAVAPLFNPNNEGHFPCLDRITCLELFRCPCDGSVKLTSVGATLFLHGSDLIISTASTYWSVHPNLLSVRSCLMFNLQWTGGVLHYNTTW